MKKNILLRILLILAELLLLYRTVGTALQAEDPLSAIAPFVALLAVVGYLLYDSFRGPRVNAILLAKTEQLYAPYLGTAFSHKPATRRKLLSLLAVSEQGKPADMARAFLSLERDCRDENDLAPVLFFAARATAAAGNRTAAISLYRRTIGEMDDFAPAWSNLAALYQLNEDYPAAEECFERALALEPDHAQCHLNLATLYLLTGRAFEAMTTAQTAIAKDPNLREGYLVLALAAAREKKKSEADRCARKCVELGGNESEIDRLISAMLRGDDNVLKPAEPDATLKRKGKK